MEHREIFLDDDDRLAFLELLHDVAGGTSWAVHALCLMTTHYHLVLESTRESLSGGMHRLNGAYAQSFNRRHARWGHLFGHRYSCRVIESERYLSAVCRYVVLNPVEAGLCERPGEWPWAQSRFPID